MILNIDPVHNFNPYFMGYFMGVELLCTLLIMTLCIFIYFKTEEIFNLTKHKGIFYFRKTFLFFAISYFLRFFMVFIRLSSEPPINSNVFFPLLNILVSYTITMAIFFLFLSTTWKKFNSKYVLIFTNLIAILISIFAFLIHEPQLILILHFILFLTTISLAIQSHKNKSEVMKKNNFSNLVIIYVLLFLFWFISMMTLGNKVRIPFEYSLFSQILSAVIFTIIYFKVRKWLN